MLPQAQKYFDLHVYVRNCTDRETVNFIKQTLDNQSDSHTEHSPSDHLMMTQGLYVHQSSHASASLKALRYQDQPR